VIGDLTYLDGRKVAIDQPVQVIRNVDRELFQLPRLFGRTDFPVGDAALPTSNPYPDLRVDALADVVLLPRHVIIDGDYRHLLSQSFKKRRRQRHFGVDQVGDLTYRLRRRFDVADERRLGGPVFYLDCEFPDIYGHHLLEVWMQTWALDLLDRDDLTFATSIMLRPYVTQMLGQLGVPAERIVAITGPLRCQLLYVASPAVLARRYVHPVCNAVIDRMRGLTPDAWPGEPLPGPRIYVSRSRIDERPMINEPEIEQLAVEAGYEIFHAQDHSLAEQLAVFGQATHVIGPGGSGMHNAIFTGGDSNVLILGSTGWFTVIDILLSQSRYHLGYVFGDPLEPPEQGHRTKAPWRLDPDLFRAALADPWFKDPTSLRNKDG
jgi:capsular polysaccharide biosynthesis protein